MSETIAISDRYEKLKTAAGMNFSEISMLPLKGIFDERRIVATSLLSKNWSIEEERELYYRYLWCNEEIKRFLAII